MMAASFATEKVMPSIFEVSVAAFAIGMATNTNVPNDAPQKPQVVVEQVQESQAAPAPASKPAETDVAQANPQADDAAH